MIDYKNIIKNQRLRLKLINLLRIIPNTPYLKFVYRMKVGKHLNLKHPVGFNEKINWLKLHDIHPEYTQLVDKYEVRDYIKQKTGKDMMFPLLGVWDSFEEIDFDALPQQFVLKCTHDSGSVKVIKDKKEMNHEQLKRFYHDCLKLNSYTIGREYPYKDVKPRIIAEEFMSCDNGGTPNDYKFFCFNGEPKLMYIASERDVDVAFDFFDMDFRPLDIDYIHRRSGKHFEKPVTFEQMKELAKQLSQGMKFVRMDFYEINGKLYFGEFTFFSAGGFYLFHPDEWEKRLGDWIVLENID